MKFAFIDTETTGFNEKVNSVWQIGIIVTDDSLNEVDRINLKFRPRSGCKLEKSALEKTGMSVADFQALEMSYAEGFAELIKFLNKHIDKFNKQDKLQFVAYNAEFDVRFVRQFFLDNDDSFFGSWFWHPAICVMMHAAWMTRKVRDTWDASFRLGSMCEVAGIQFSEDEAHDAMYDIEKTLALYKYFDD